MMVARSFCEEIEIILQKKLEECQRISVEADESRREAFGRTMEVG